MNNDKFDTILQAFLNVVIKHRDEKGLLYFAQTLAKVVADVDFVCYIKDYFLDNADTLTEDDVSFFENTTNNFILQENNVVEKTVNKVKKETTDMRKIKKAIELFEKNGLQLGLDYSFHNGKIRMKKESKDKIQELLG